MRHKTLIYILLALTTCVTPRSANAADKAHAGEPEKENQKGTQLVTEGGKVVKELQDKNGDGKPDVTIYYVNGKKHHGEGASHFDGTIDTWYIYSINGTLRQIAKDTNKDGKPDQFVTMLKGRNLMLREYDRNFDGRIDKRQLVAWSAARLKIPGQGPIPGYVPLWTEFDDNYDGKIDKYTEKGNKNPSKEKIGQLIDGRPTPAREEEKPAQSALRQDGSSSEERRIKQLNEQYGLKE